MKKVLFYSQNREDLYIKAFFPDVKNGFYIDIGAFDPIYHSVTKLFYDEGWNGINVEPQKYYIEKLNNSRKRDTNLQVGVSDKKGNLTLRDYKGGGLSTFSENMKKEYEADSFMNKVIHKDYKVQVITLNDVFEKVPKNTKVNFLKVDVEGLEFEVFKSNNWKANRAELICVESNHMQKNWKAILEEANYNKVFFDGLNEYYLAEESMSRLSLFDFPKMFLRDAEIVPYEIDSQMDELKSELKKTYKNIRKLENEIETLHSETKMLYEQKEKLESHIANQERKINELEAAKHSIRHNSKQLVRSVRRKIKNRSNKS